MNIYGIRLIDSAVPVFTALLSTFLLMGFSGSTVVKESAYQCRRLLFDPWVGKIPWSKKWQPIPVFLPGKCHGQRSLACYI